MKKVFTCFAAIMASTLLTFKVSAAELVPQTGDSGSWLYIILAVAAAVVLVVLLIAGKKR